MRLLRLQTKFVTNPADKTRWVYSHTVQLKIPRARQAHFQGQQFGPLGPNRQTRTMIQKPQLDFRPTQLRGHQFLRHGSKMPCVLISNGHTPTARTHSDITPRSHDLHMSKNVAGRIIKRLHSTASCRIVFSHDVCTKQTDHGYLVWQEHGIAGA